MAGAAWQDCGMNDKGRKVLVVIPTYDERDNVGPVAAAVLRAAPFVDVLFVDDDSPDGTGEVLDAAAAADSRVKVLHHGPKAGLGRAYADGFRWGLERGYDRLFEMDADLSHDPRKIPAFVEAAESADLGIGTRYKGGLRVINWPLRRLLISMSAGMFVRAVTGMPVSDPTGGYKCYTAETLRAIGLDGIRSNGYSFQIETTFEAWRRGYTVAEVPITFEDRRSGHSKFSKAIAREAFWMVWRLAWRNRFRRRPRPRK